MTRAPLTPEQRAEIRACAEAATPGPWEWTGSSAGWMSNGEDSFLYLSLGWFGCPPMDSNPNDLSHIARMDPPTTIALLDALDEAERAVERKHEDGWAWAQVAGERQNRIADLERERDEARAEVERLRLNSKIEQDATNCHMEATAKYQRRESELVGHLRTLIGEIDEWESAVAKIIERPPDCPWKSLEKARAALGGDA